MEPQVGSSLNCIDPMEVFDFGTMKSFLCKKVVLMEGPPSEVSLYIILSLSLSLSLSLPTQPGAPYSLTN